MDDPPYADPPKPAPRPTPRPWGFWATIGWSLLCGAALIVLYIVVGVIVAIASAIGLLPPKEATYGGPVLVFLITLANLAVIPMVWGLAALRRMSLRRYLGLESFTERQGMVWLAVILLYVLGMHVLSGFVEMPEAERFMRELMSHREGRLLIFIAVAGFAPVAEEVFFRGFMYKGFAHSPLGPVGAIVLTAALWAIIHVQYDWIVIGGIFIGGVLLGLARWRSGSVLLCVLLHVVWNALAMVTFLLFEMSAGGLPPDAVAGGEMTSAARLIQAAAAPLANLL